MLKYPLASTDSVSDPAYSSQQLHVPEPTGAATRSQVQQGDLPPSPLPSHAPNSTLSLPTASSSRTASIDTCVTPLHEAGVPAPRNDYSFFLMNDGG